MQFQFTVGCQEFGAAARRASTTNVPVDQHNAESVLHELFRGADAAESSADGQHVTLHRLVEQAAIAARVVETSSRLRLAFGAASPEADLFRSLPGALTPADRERLGIEPRSNTPVSPDTFVKSMHIQTEKKTSDGKRLKSTYARDVAKSPRQAMPGTMVWRSSALPSPTLSAMMRATTNWRYTNIRCRLPLTETCDGPNTGSGGRTGGRDRADA
jgi:hypothetical protein